MKHPLEWKWTFVGEVADINRKSLPENFDPRASFFYIDLAGIEDGRVRVPDGPIRFADAPSRARRLFDRGDVLMATVRPNLEGFAIADFNTKGFVCSTGFAVLHAKAGIDNRYIFQSLHSSWFHRQYAALTNGSNYPALNSTQIAELEILLPPEAEQRKIASILSAFDSATSKLGLLLRKKNEQLRGLRQQLLNGSRRFSKFSRTKWRRVQLSEVLKHIFRPVNWSPTDVYRLISIRRRCGGLFRREDLLGADYKTTDLHEIRTGDFLVSKRQVVHGAWAMVAKEFSGCHVSKEYSILANKAPDVLYMPFFDWLSHEQRMWHLAFLASDGVHREKLIFDSKDFLRHYIELPPTIEEQQRIVEVLDACDQEIRLLEAELEALKLQKRGLMQKLLTGEKRVKP